MSVIKPSILDRVKAKLQSVFARHQPSELHDEPETSNTSTGAAEVSLEPSLPWLTDTQRDILQEIERGSTTERRVLDRARILLNFDTIKSKKGVARTLGIDIKTVRKWYTRWDEVREVLSPL
jgi:DNA-binding CsgD family transcriptional regulator